LEYLDGENHVLLSSLDETVIQRGKEFHLAVRKYPGGVFHPGHKYIREFYVEPIPTLIYRVGGVVLKKEILLAKDEMQVLIRYTLVEANSPTKLKLHPFLAFRQIHKLSKANMDANTKCIDIKNGIKAKLYNDYPYLFMQLSKKSEFISAPNWYYNIEYSKEQERGYDYQEDLLVPGYFEFNLKRGESIVFSGSTKEITTSSLNRKFNNEIGKRILPDNYEKCLENAAQQFIRQIDNRTEIVAGFPYFGTQARDTFVSLSGLTLARGDAKTCKLILDTISEQFKDCQFKNRRKYVQTDSNPVDTPLLYFSAIQKYVEFTGQHKQVWKDYSKIMKEILGCYKSGIDNIEMHNNGLIHAGQNGFAHTWMNAYVNGKAVTPRVGYSVEINALWYNAVSFALELAQKAGDNKFIDQWKELPDKIANSFVELFWDKKKEYLADYVMPAGFGNETEYKNWDVRPNQIFAASLPYSPVNDNIKKAVIDIVEKELLTKRGIRSLSPKNPNYKSRCFGNVIERDLAYHQGTVWPWLIAPFAEAYLKLHEKSGVHFIEKIYQAFENEMNEHGIGCISGVYNGDPPHQGNGAISHASSTSALLYTKYLIEKYKSLNTK
jgi:predicted glycogen debranching enzyme